MINKKVPQRTCIVTKEKTNKKDLIRIVRTPEKNVVVDTTGKINGRGCYLKKDLEVIEKAKKNKILDKALEVEIPEELFEELNKIMEK